MCCHKSSTAWVRMLVKEKAHTQGMHHTLVRGRAHSWGRGMVHRWGREMVHIMVKGWVHSMGSKGYSWGMGSVGLMDHMLERGSHTVGWMDCSWVMLVGRLGLLNHK